MNAQAATAVPAFAVRVRERSWIAAWWAAGRLVVLASALVVHAVGPTGYLKEDERFALGILNAWDGRWYRMIAQHGYLLVPGTQSDPAFFPLFPLLLRAAATLGIGAGTAGLLISNAALLVALVAFEALSRELFGASTARRATVYVAIFPLGFVFSMSYPQSVVFAAVALAALAALRRRWGLAAISGAIAALGRPEGAFVALPILAVAWRNRASMSPVERGLAIGALLAPAAAFGSYPLYLARVLHDPLAWSTAQRAWGRRFSPTGIVTAFDRLPHALGQNPWLARDVVFFVLYLALLAVARRARVPIPWLAGGLAVVLLPVFSGAFDSVARFGLLAPAIFWSLAWVGRNRRTDLAIRGACLVLLAAATVTIPFVFP